MADNLVKEPERKGNSKNHSDQLNKTWLKSMVEKNQTNKNQSKESLNTKSSHISPSILITWLDKLFDLFQQYAAAFNIATSETALQMETERVVITPDLFTKMLANDTLHFSGRVHTHHWNLVLKGNLHFITGYLIPADKLIAFSTKDPAFEKFFQIDIVWQDHQMQWKYNDTVIAYEQLPVIARQLFTRLINVAQESLNEHNPFSFELLEEKELSFSPIEDSQMMKVEGDASSVVSSFAQMVKEATENETAKTSSSKFGEGDKTMMPQGKEANTKTMDFLTACDILKQAIDNEVESIVASGLQAFQSENFSFAEQALKKSTKLKSLQKQIHEMIMEWQKSMSEM